MGATTTSGKRVEGMATVLVVEDEEPILALLSALLEDEGYRVATARNGREGLDCLAIAQPDAVLCDVMMPVIDGATLCRYIQADPAYRSIPVVLMSAARPPLASSGCRYAAFLAKPFTLDSVLDVLERVIGEGVAAT